MLQACRIRRMMALSLLLASACNGSWSPGGPDARDLPAPVVFDDAAAAAHADAPHVQPREAGAGHHTFDAVPDRPDAGVDHHEVAAEVSEDAVEDGAEGGADVAP